MAERGVSVGWRVDEQNPGHTKVSVFIGRNPGARGHAGQLTIRTDEWEELAEELDVLAPLEYPKEAKP